MVCQVVLIWLIPCNLVWSVGLCAQLHREVTFQLAQQNQPGNHTPIKTVFQRT
jgi:hypothetical protein